MVNYKMNTFIFHIHVKVLCQKRKKMFKVLYTLCISSTLHVLQRLKKKKKIRATKSEIAFKADT